MKLPILRKLSIYTQFLKKKITLSSAYRLSSYRAVNTINFGYKKIISS